jgi:4-hydroxy-tetrahydrodipicolinate synthase
MNKLFSGLGVALVTPFKAGAVDFDALASLIEHNINGGVDFLVSLGTTGETATLTEVERIDVLEFTIHQAAGRVKIVAGFGGNNTAALVASIKAYHFKGVDAILSASPAYNKPTQAGIFEHYMAIEAISPVPIIIYNVPGRTASNISASTTLRLANASAKFIGIKEASGDLAQCMQIVKGSKPASFAVLSGDDNLTLAMLSLGMDGLISVVANAFPAAYTQLVHAGLHAQFEQARKIHYQYMDLVDLLFVEGNPAGIKAVLEQMGICDAELRLPLVPVGMNTKKSIETHVSILLKELPV